MNARQKAKVYKRKYIALMNRFVKLHHVELPAQQHKIDTVKFEQFYPAAIIDGQNSYYLRDVIFKEIVHGLANDIDKYIDYHVEFCPHINKYRLYGEIKVVAKEEKI